MGKKYAGRLFDVIAHPDGRFELIPVRIVASAPARAPQIVQRLMDGYHPAVTRSAPSGRWTTEMRWSTTRARSRNRERLRSNYSVFWPSIPK